MADTLARESTDEMPTSLTDARAIGARHFFTGRPCRRGHIARRFSVNGQCADCLREGCRAYHVAKRGERLQYMSDYAKCNAEENARRSREYRNKLEGDSLKALAEKEKKWKRENPDRVRVSGENRRAKIRQSLGTVSAKEWRDIKAIYTGTCLCCGKREPEIKLTMDHVIPLSLGGQHAAVNIQPLCGRCNSSKGVRDTDYRKGWPHVSPYLG